MRRDCDARRERAVLAVLFPPGIVAPIDGTLVVVGGHLAALGLSTGGVVLFFTKMTLISAANTSVRHD